MLRFIIDGCLSGEADNVLTYEGNSVTFLFRNRANRESFEVEVVSEGPDWRSVNTYLVDEVLPVIFDVMSFHRKSPLLTNIPTRVLKSQRDQRNRQVILVNERREPNNCIVDREVFEEVERSLRAELGDVPRNALRWLRNSYRPLTIRDRFVFAWLSLEALAGTRVVQKICPACQHNSGQYSTADREAAREIVRRWRPDVEDRTFRYWATELRNAVFHGGRVPNAQFLADLRGATDPIIDCVERQINLSLGFDFRRRPAVVLGADQIYHRHHFVEFEADNVEEEFASNSPNVVRLEELIDGRRDPEQELGIRLLNWGDNEGW
jgi:hypothetical protein